MKKIDLLCAEQDLEALQPVLEQLKAKGVCAVQPRSFTKDRTVLAVLSENLYADAEKSGALLDLIGGGAENVMPLQLDGAHIPENIMNALYSRNIIMPEGRADTGGGGPFGRAAGKENDAERSAAARERQRSCGGIGGENSG